MSQITVDLNLITRKDITPSEKIIYMVIVEKMNNTSKSSVIIDNKIFIDVTGKSQSSITKYLKHMDKIGLIHIVYDNHTFTKGDFERANTKRFIFLEGRKAGYMKSIITKKQNDIDKAKTAKFFNSMTMDIPIDNVRENHYTGEYDEPYKA